MAFLNPLLLFGISAVAAPIIIHMFMNRRIKPVIWGAMRFLRASVQRNQKRMNLEDILLLVLRCLILILLALALARPAFHSANALAAGAGSQTAVIALDNSYSMAQSDGGATRFDQARQAAEQLIDSMQPGSAVALFLFSDVVKAAIPEPTFDLNLARKMVRDAALSDRTTNVSAVLKQSLETLRRHASGAQRIYLITDGQASGWRQFDDIGAVLRDPEVKTRVILVGGPEEHNLCVSDLRLASAMADTGEAAQFDAEVTNFGSSEARQVTVRLNVDQESAGDEGIIDSIPPGGAKRISLSTKFRSAGYHTVTARINADHLPADDQRTIALRARDDVRVLIVTDDPNPTAPEHPAFYLRNALAPVPPSERDNYVVKTKTITAPEMDSTKLADYDAVVLANVASLSPAALAALTPYLNRGGGLVIFPGDRTDAAFYNENLGGKSAILPALLGPLRGKPDQRDTFFTLQEKNYTHPIVSIWNDPGAGTLATAHFYCATVLKPQSGHTGQAGEAQIILKYADGSPAIMERTWGRGCVILFSSSANSAWNDLPLHPAYLPLVERTLGSILDRQDARLNIPVGAPFEFVCDPDWINKDAIVTRPGESGESGSLRRIGAEEGVPLLRFEDTEKAGAYEAAIKTDPPAVVKFAVQSDPSESDLAGLGAAQLDSIAQAARVVHWTQGMRLDEQEARERSGSELWTALASLMLVTACVETVLGGIFSAAK